MASKFQLKDYLSNNRELVIAKFNELSDNEYYNGITLKSFMLQVFQQMSNNNPKSENKAASLLPFVLEAILNNNAKISVTYTKPYSDTNHAKAVRYFGSDKVRMMSNAK